MTPVEKLCEEAKKVGQLSILSKMTIRFTRDRGEPDPTPAVPFEAVLSYRDFQELVERAKK